MGQHCLGVNPYVVAGCGASIYEGKQHCWTVEFVLLQDAVPEDKMKEEIMDSIQKGNFTMRILKDQLQNILKMGPVGQVMGMIPGFGNSMMPKVCQVLAHTPSSFYYAFLCACLPVFLSAGPVSDLLWQRHDAQGMPAPLAIPCIKTNM